MTAHRRLSDLTAQERVALGRLMWAFVKAGWNPPAPSDDVYDRIMEDITKQTHTGRNTQWGAGKSSAPSLELTPFEIRCLCMFAEGGTYASVGRRLGISAETVKSTLKSVRERLGAKNTTHAVALAIRTGTIV